MALQAVKELALYLKDGAQREAVLGRVGEWLTDMSCTGNATVLLVAGLVYLLEENYVEALKCCHSGQSLEMWVEPRRRRAGCTRGGRGGRRRGGTACKGVPCLLCRLRAVAALEAAGLGASTALAQ